MDSIRLCLLYVLIIVIFYIYELLEFWSLFYVEVLVVIDGYGVIYLGW